jgi:hypothetical protein
MLPCGTLHNGADQLNADTKFNCQCGLSDTPGGMSRSDRDDLLNGEFGMGALLPSYSSLPTPLLVQHVSDVVHVGALEQVPASRQEDASHFVDAFVVVTDACRRITRVPDQILSRQGLVGGELPSGAVSQHRAVMPDTELSVPLAESRSLPQPAWAGAINIRPESGLASGFGNSSTMSKVACGAAEDLGVVLALSYEVALALQALARGIIRLHRVPPVPCATPRPARTGAGHSCVNYTIHQIVRAA